jgi:hypothetical protein
MKKILAYFLYTLLLSAIVCACSNDLDINQVYVYDLVSMPIQEKIIQGETVEIQCELVKKGNYKEAKYTIRYFQSKGKGSLTLDENTSLLPNEHYSLDKDKFCLYYTSLCLEQQTIDIYIEDNFGQVVQKSFSFTNENAEEPKEEPVDYSFTFTTLPIPSQILLNDTIEIRCQLIKMDESNDATYAIRYFQTSGKGELLLGKDVSMQPNELYNLDAETFRLNYVSSSEERHSIDIYIVDSRGQIIQKSFGFENIPIDPAPEIDISFEFETLPVPKTITSGETVEIRCITKQPHA